MLQERMAAYEVRLGCLKNLGLTSGRHAAGKELVRLLDGLLPGLSRGRSRRRDRLDPALVPYTLANRGGVGQYAVRHQVRPER